MKLLIGVIALCAGALAAGPCESRTDLAQVEIFDRATGQSLETYRHRGRHYVVGEPGHEYEIRIRNRSAGRLLAVTSVDGVNVVTGATASPAQSGYVLAPGERVEIDGWRKSLDEVAAFVFTALPDSYAARTGRPDNVGVVGVALFRERPRRDESQLAESAQDAAAGAPAAAKSAQELGTGHGERRDSHARYTSFERQSQAPAEVISLFYDSRSNLVARGIVPGARRTHEPPNPFPGQFVVDPP